MINISDLSKDTDTAFSCLHELIFEQSKGINLLKTYQNIDENIEVSLIKLPTKWLEDGSIDVDSYKEYTQFLVKSNNSSFDVPLKIQYDNTQE